MIMILLALVAGGLGWWKPRLWLLALPVAAAGGTGFLLAMPGTRVDPDTPLPFLLVLVEACLAAGVLFGRRRLSTPPPT